MNDAPDNPPALSVVIPVFDEEQNLATVLSEVLETLVDEVNFEIIVVDDGSGDGTWDVISQLASEDRRIRCVAHRTNRGKSAALVTAAKAARGDWLGTMDGDGQNDPADLLALYREAEAQQQGEGGTWIAAGRRRRRRDTFLKKAQSRIANHVRRWLLHDVTPDTGCGLKVLPRRAFLELPRFAHMHRFLPALVQQHGGSVVSVQVEDRARLYGRSKYGFANRAFVGLFDLCGVIWLGRRAIGPIETREQEEPSQ